MVSTMGPGEAERWNSGVVSLLDDEHRALVEGIWDELEREAGVRWSGQPRGRTCPINSVTTTSMRFPTS